MVMVAWVHEEKLTDSVIDAFQADEERGDEDIQTGGHGKRKALIEAEACEIHMVVCKESKGS